MGTTEWSRRDLLRLGLAAWTLSAGLRPGRAGARGAARRRARYFVLVGLTGGVDGIYATDPKLKTHVEPWVDVPYARDAIVTNGQLQLGPHFAPLAPFAGRMAIINGVQVGTANHDTGLLQAARLRSRIKPRTPTILDLVAREREGQPLGCVSIGAVTAFAYSPSSFGAMPAGLLPPPDGAAAEAAPSDDLFADVEATAPADLERLARIMRAQARGLRAGAPSPERATTAAHLEQVAALFERLPSCTPFRPETWSTDKTRQGIALHLQRALWALENDLTCGVYLGIGLNWDTHSNNAYRQAEASGHFAPMFARFLAALDARRSPAGRLSEHTALIAGSELGRFPRINSNDGKDHLAQTSYLCFGPAFRTGAAAFGHTGRAMEGQPISIRTGRPGGTDQAIPAIDDVGATLLHLAGIDPARYGYDGRILDFLVAS